MMALHDEPNFHTRLEALVLGEEDAELTSHIQACEQCQQSLFAVQNLVTSKRTTGGLLQDPPAALMASLHELYARVRPDLLKRQEQTTVRGRLGEVRRIIADLVLDSGATPQLAGLRSQGTERKRQFSFASDLADLDLEITPQQPLAIVNGQLGMDIIHPGLTIRFEHLDLDREAESEPESLQATISEEGYFQLPLAAGVWTAIVDLPEASIEFLGIRV